MINWIYPPHPVTVTKWRFRLGFPGLNHGNIIWSWWSRPGNSSCFGVPFRFGVPDLSILAKNFPARYTFQGLHLGTHQSHLHHLHPQVHHLNREVHCRSVKARFLPRIWNGLYTFTQNRGAHTVAIMGGGGFFCLVPKKHRHVIKWYLVDVSYVLI